MTLRMVRRLIVAVIGSTVVLIGLVMTVLPGPAIVVIPAGLAILATEFAWAHRLLNRVKKQMGLKPKAKEPARAEPESLGLREE